MENDLSLELSASIAAPLAEVWKALTEPKWIRKYFLGREVISDFKEGSSIVFRGSWEKQNHVDHGTILKVEPCKLLRFSYWSPRMGLSNNPEQYVTVTYELSKNEDRTIVKITEENLPDPPARRHALQSWRIVLRGLKRLLEMAPAED